MSEAYNKTNSTGISQLYYVRLWGLSFDGGHSLVPYDVTDTNSSSIHLVDSFVGEKLPNWKSIIRSGGNATTPASGVKYHIDQAFQSIGVGYRHLPDYDFWTQSNNGEIYGYVNLDIPSFFTPPLDVVASVTNRVIRRFLEKSESVRSSVESGQDFGEYKESLESMIRPLSSLKKHVLGYFPSLMKVKKRYRDVVSLKKALTDTYLEWTFGWKPLAADVADAFVGLQNRSRFSNRQMVSASASETFGGNSEEIGGLFTIGPLVISQTKKSYSSFTMRYKGAIETSVKKDGLISRSQVLQLDLPHFLPTAWDLLPYSFIADYFTNVGDIIRAFSLIDCRPSWGVKTIRTRGIIEYGPLMHGKPFYSPGQASTIFKWSSGGSSKYVKTSFQRTALDPSIDFIPSFQFSLPTSHKPWENLAVLLLAHSNSLVPFFK